MAGKSGFFLDSAAFMGAMRMITPVLNAASVPFLEATGEAIVEVAKTYAPVMPESEQGSAGGGAISGQLRDDIKVQGSGVDARGPYVDVGTIEPYALPQEFGNTHNKATPFMRPAIAQITSSNLHGQGLNLRPRPRPPK